MSLHTRQCPISPEAEGRIKVQDDENLGELIQGLRSFGNGFNPPASEQELSELQQTAGPLPGSVLALYRNHNGSGELAGRAMPKLIARLMPIVEALKAQSALNRARIPSTGNSLCLWTDDNSNYCSIYTTGPLAGWLTILDHEEPILAPAFRSTTSFLSRLLADGRMNCDGHDVKSPAYDLPSLAREIPVTVVGDENAEEDLRLATHFKDLFKTEQDTRQRCLYAFCSICLTPFEGTGELVSFLGDEDMYVAESAIRLMDLRRYPDAVEILEKLAMRSRINSGHAAMMCLVRLNTSESKEAIARLLRNLEAPGIRVLQMALNPIRPLPESRWP
jgi:hypothetical protein